VRRLIEERKKEKSHQYQNRKKNLRVKEEISQIPEIMNLIWRRKSRIMMKEWKNY